MSSKRDNRTGLTRSTLQQGRIIEEGTYRELMRTGGAFSHLVSEFGGAAGEKKEEQDAEEEEAIEPVPTKHADEIIRLTKKHMGRAAGTGKLEVSPAFWLC